MQTALCRVLYFSRLRVCLREWCTHLMGKVEGSWLAQALLRQFQFFHSSHRMVVEQAFGILVRRRVILWRPLSYVLVDTIPIVSAAMRLRNFDIDEDGKELRTFAIDATQSELQNAAFERW